MSPASGDELVVVGRIVRVHGLKGEVVVRPASDGADLLLDVTHVTLRRKGVSERREIKASREQKGAFVLAIDGIADRTASESWIGAELLIARSEFPEPEEGEFYEDSLVGMDVVEKSGVARGKVVSLESAGPMTWLVVRTEVGDILVPFAEPLVTVDEDARRIVVDAPEGLFDPERAEVDRR